MKFIGALFRTTGLIREKARSLAAGAKPLVLCAAGLLVLLTVSGLAVTAARRGHTDAPASAQKTAANNGAPEEPPLVFMHPLLPPAQYSLPDDYRLFRPRRERWDAQEADEWFVEPDGALLEQLHEVNGLMIDNLLENAP